MGNMPSSSSGSQEQMLIASEKKKSSSQLEETSDSRTNRNHLDSSSCALESDGETSQSSQVEIVHDADEPEDLTVIDKSRLPIANEDLQQVDWDIFYSTGELVKKGEGNTNKMIDAIGSQRLNLIILQALPNIIMWVRHLTTPLQFNGKKGQSLFFFFFKIRFAVQIREILYCLAK
jgi:hypothetical protein